MNTPCPEPFFTPDPQAAAASRVVDFARWAARHRGVAVDSDYASLHLWSVTDLEGFWCAVWEYFDVDADTPYERVLEEERMPGAVWFPGATLNYAHHALRNLGDDDTAIVALDESGVGYEVTGERLRAQVASVAATLRDLGVGKGDRVVGYLPNTPHAIIAFLAAMRPGRGVVGVRTGLRAEGRGRPVRPARTHRPDRGGRLPLQRCHPRPS